MAPTKKKTNNKDNNNNKGDDDGGGQFHQDVTKGSHHQHRKQHYQNTHTMTKATRAKKRKGKETEEEKNGDSTIKNEKRTADDKKLQAYNDVSSLLASILQSVSTIQSTLFLLRDENLSKAKEKKYLKELDTLAIVIKQKCNNTSATMKSLSPIPYMSYAQNRLRVNREAKRRRMDDDNNNDVKAASSVRVSNHEVNKTTSKEEKMKLAPIQMKLPKEDIYSVSEAIPQLAAVESGHVRYRQIRYLKSVGLLPMPWNKPATESRKYWIARLTRSFGPVERRKAITWRSEACAPIRDKSGGIWFQCGDCIYYTVCFRPCNIAIFYYESGDC